MVKRKKYLQGVTFFVEPDMYAQIRKISDQREISLSEFLRELVQHHLREADSKSAESSET